MSKPLAKSKKTPPAPRSSGALPPLHDLVYQALETEMGGIEIYVTALSCVQNDDLRAEWTKYLDQTKRHVEVVRELCGQLALDPERDTPGRQVVRHIGRSLVAAMQMAKGAGDPGAAEIVAAECITLAETKDHANWALIQALSEVGSGKQQKALDDAQAAVEDEEDEHLYHSQGWARELWMQALGLEARLPPPEEVEDVQSMEEAAQAKKKADTKRGR